MNNLSRYPIDRARWAEYFGQRWERSQDPSALHLYFWYAFLVLALENE